jgi:hypothetical protein
MNNMQESTTIILTANDPIDLNVGDHILIRNINKKHPIPFMERVVQEIINEKKIITINLANNKTREWNTQDCEIKKYELR